MKPVNVGLLGLGTVGGGTFNVLERNAEEITRRAGRGIRVSHAAAREITNPDALQPRRHRSHRRRLRRGRASRRRDHRRADRRLRAGAANWCCRAIANGKHVVTANKALIAKHGNEIFAAAQRGAASWWPSRRRWPAVSRSSRRSARAWPANQIEWLAGIINGTGNFILTEMRDKGRDFAEVLKEAQAARLCRGRSDLRRRRHRRRAQTDHPRLHRLRHSACSSTRSTPKASASITREDVSYAERIRLSHQASRHRPPYADRDRTARASRR